MNNNRVGRLAEKRYVEMVDYKNGYVIEIPKSHLGQPFDMVALFDNKLWFTDVKNSGTDNFRFSGIQENQELSMKLLTQRKGLVKAKIGFSIYFETEGMFCFLNFDDYMQMKARGYKRVNIDNQKLEVLGWLV